METRTYRDLLVWQRSMALVREIYAATEGFPRTEQFGVVSQLRRAAVSVPSNIAEGRGRLTGKSFALVLSQARGSLYELQTQMELAGDLGFIGRERAQSVMSETAEIASMIQGLTVSLQK
ncbi:MAG TPA: four helix bundle protein [Acidobacteriaceae bacterium]|nr:four helix bundle protein [Acidobacteriaceae bacterium]